MAHSVCISTSSGARHSGCVKSPGDLGSAIALVAQDSGRAVADELLTAFVPKAIGEGFEAGKEGDRFDGLKERFGAVDRKSVV